MGASYKFSELFDISSFKKGFAGINKELDKLDDRITEREKTKKGSGKALIEESKQIEKLIESEEDLIKVKVETAKLSKQIVEANKKAAKEESDILKTRAKAEKDAEKFLKQYNSQEIKRTEILKIKKRELRENAKAEIALEASMKKEVKTLAELEKRNNNLIRVRKNLNTQTKAGKARYDQLTVAIEKNNRTLLNQDKKIGIFRRNVGNYISGVRSLTASFGKLGGVLGAAGIATGVAGLVSVFNNFINRSRELSKISRQIENQFNLSGNAAKASASKVKALADTFGKDFNEILVSANTVSKEFNVSLDFALKNIQEGFLKGSDNSGQFIDILKEYPAQFKAANINADTFFAIVNQQVKEGIYSDKGIDAIKEGGLRLRENTQAVQDALIPLDKSVKKQIEQEIAAGNTFKAIQLVSESLKDTSLTAQETQTIIADVFGGAGEDAGLRYLQLLSDIDTNLSDVENQTSAVQEAQLGLSESYNGFVQSVSDGSGIISRAWASLQDGASNFLETLRLINEGSARTTEVVKKDIGFYEELETGYKKVAIGLDKITDAQKRRELATKIATQTRAKELLLQQRIDKALKDGVPINNTALRNLQLRADFYKQLAERIKSNYITAKQSELIIDEKVSTSKDGQIAKTKEQEAAQRELNKQLREQERILKALLKEGDKASKQPLRGEDLGLDALLGPAEKPEDSPEVLAQEAENSIRLENEKHLQEQLRELRFQAAEDTAQFGADLFASSQDAKLERIQQDIDQEKALLDEQLKNGEINQIQFDRKIAELNKKSRQEEGKAEKKKSLFDITINTAVAVAKALGSAFPPINFINAAAVALQGGIQAALVAATPIPGFYKGKVNIDGPGTGTSDSIVSRISKGESVIKAKSTKKSTKLLNLINDEVLTDSNASEILSKYNFSNNSTDNYLRKMTTNSEIANNLLSQFGIAMQKKNGSYIITKLNGSNVTVNLDG